MIKTDIVLHPYLLITQQGAFKMYIFHFKSWNMWKKNGGIFSCDTQISPRTVISALFSKLVTRQIVLPGYRLRNNCRNRHSRTKLCVTRGWCWHLENIYYTWHKTLMSSWFMLWFMSWFKPLKSTKQTWGGVGGRAGGGGKGPDTDTHPLPISPMAPKTYTHPSSNLLIHPSPHPFYPWPRHRHPSLTHFTHGPLYLHTPIP